MLVFEDLLPVNLTVRLSLLAQLAVFLLHLLRRVSHIDHYPFNFVHLDATDHLNGCPVYNFLLYFSFRTTTQQLFPNVFHIPFCLLARTQYLFWCAIDLVLERMYKRRELRGTRVVALEVLSGRFAPLFVLLQFGQCSFLLFEPVRNCP